MIDTRKCTYMNRTRGPAPFVELRQNVPSRAEAISPVVDRLMRFIRRLSPSDDVSYSVDEIEVALREALTNAIVHGNHEIPGKYVYVVCRCSMDGEVLLRIRDEGVGFDSRAVKDPTTPENIFRTHGRGVYLMKALMDEVSFEENGTVVRMRKRLSPATQSQTTLS